MWSHNILTFFKQLDISPQLPKGVEVLNPYQHKETFHLCEQFYHQYYSDANQRCLIVGINPGRLGGGLTGIPFTDPHKLESFCNITNSLPKKSELSADFIYQMINEFGGPRIFYSKFYFTSVSPLGYTMKGKNLNYYDIPKLQTVLKSFIVDCMEEQLQWNVNRKVCFVLGEGKNFKYLKNLNKEYQFFETLVPLPHPRFIMQYRRKRLKEFIELYLEKLKACNS